MTWLWLGWWKSLKRDEDEGVTTPTGREPSPSIMVTPAVDHAAGRRQKLTTV